MADIEGGQEAGLRPDQGAAEVTALRAGQKAAQAWRDARVAQRSAADSMYRSAESHEQTAKLYEEAAEHSRHRVECLERAAYHHQHAQKDRLMAQTLQQMAEADLPDSLSPLSNRD